MPPIPCMHCGTNFMRTTSYGEIKKLCNNCLIIEKNKFRIEMKDLVDILIKCTREEQIEVEEHCINKNITFSQYFLQLHLANMIFERETKKMIEEGKKNPEKEEELKEEVKIQKKAGKK